MELNAEELARLDQYCNANNILVTIRSKGYIKRKMEIEKPVAFILFREQYIWGLDAHAVVGGP